ncbi:MAG: ATP-binding cassette subfamily B protein RaxB [Paraglaciecola sp.]|jgi:ATP-binding cassette subfamily B protein RaxB
MVSFKGANVQQLMTLAEQLDMVGCALKIDMDDLKYPVFHIGI